MKSCQVSFYCIVTVLTNSDYRIDLLEEAKAEVSKVPFQHPIQVSPDPDDLFDDI